MIESRQAGARRHRNTEFLPQPLTAELQLLDGRGQYVLDDHQTRVRRDDQSLGRQESVCDLACVLVQQRDGGYELADQAQRSIDIELQISLVRDAKDVGEPRAFNVVGHDRQARPRHRDPIDAAYARVVGVPEVR
jgi:hypothetical protein